MELSDIKNIFDNKKSLVFLGREQHPCDSTVPLDNNHESFAINLPIEILKPNPTGW